MLCTDEFKKDLTKMHSAAHTGRMPRHVPNSAGSFEARALAIELKGRRSEIDDALKERKLRVGLGQGREDVHMGVTEGESMEMREKGARERGSESDSKNSMWKCEHALHCVILCVSLCLARSLARSLCVCVCARARECEGMLARGGKLQVRPWRGHRQNRERKEEKNNAKKELGAESVLIHHLGLRR